MRYTTNNLPLVFVLWGEDFDEQMAITCITKFREAALQVKLVGLRGKEAAGMNGVGLVPDMILSQALPLAKSAQCVVVPCHSPHFMRMNNDPRVQDFFQSASENNAQFVVGQIPLSQLELFMDSINIVRCPEESEIDKSIKLLKGDLAIEPTQNSVDLEWRLDNVYA